MIALITRYPDNHCLVTRYPDNRYSIHSTKVENVRQIDFFLQNKPNFPHFYPENEDYAKKQSQFKANTNPIKPNFEPISRVANPIFNPGVYPRVLLTWLAAGECELICFPVGDQTQLLHIFEEHLRTLEFWASSCYYSVKVGHVAELR